MEYQRPFQKGRPKPFQNQLPTVLTHNDRLLIMDSENPFRGDFEDEPDFSTHIPTTNQTSSIPISKQSRLEQLKAREAELLEKQRQLSEKREEVYKSPNFPKWYPVIYVNIEEDIPPSARECVKYSLWGLMALTAATLFNILAVISVSGLPTYPKVRCFIFSLIQGFGLVYCTLHYSFEKLYDACKKRNIPFSFTVTQFALIACCVYLTIGFPDSGSVGLATFLDLVAKSNSFLSTLIALINTCLIGAGTFCEFVTLMRSQAYQRVSGVEEAQAKAATETA